MKTSVVAIVALGMVSLAVARVLAEGTNAVPAVVAVKQQTSCPVMTSNPINKKIFVDYEGKRIYLCCPGCLAAVKADPAKYVKQLEAQGITLDKVPTPAAK